MMQTADWALVISILSAMTSLAGFVWNVWSKFIYPKPRVTVHFSMVSAFRPGLGPDPDPISALCISATNMGPAETTLLSSLVMTKPHWFSEKRIALLNVLQNFPESTDYETEYYTRGGGIFAGGFPKKLAVGESFSVYLIPNHEMLARGDYDRIGFNDSFGTMHWAPRKDILTTLPYMREACTKSGKDWRAKQL
jgi:hypothetical protein